MRAKNALPLVGGVVMLVILPLLLLGLCASVVITSGRHGSDFTTFYDAGRAVLHGHSPYPTLESLPNVAGRLFAPYVYPPVAAYSMIPLSVLPFAVAVIVYFLLNLAAVGLALRLLGVSDWRCYSIAFASAPVYAAAGVGTISPILLLGVAAAWRYRDRAVAAGLLVAYVLSAKVFLWPLWLWLVRTRRFAAAGIAAGAAVTAVFASWAAIGFGGLGEYPRLLARMTQLEGPRSYSLYALFRSLGAGDGAAQVVVYGVALGALMAALLFVKGDREWLVATLGIALVATPILWPHYLVLLFVPIALMRRQLSHLWIAMLILWPDAAGWSAGNPLKILGVLVFTVVIVWLGAGGRVRLRRISRTKLSTVASAALLVTAVAAGSAAAAAPGQSVVIDVAPTAVIQGGTQHIRAIVVGSPTCTLTVRYANGATHVLAVHHVDTWRVAWTWRVGPSAAPGRATATVVCGTAGRARAAFTVKA
jgi:Glycosyltransferase family 87